MNFFKKLFNINSASAVDTKVPLRTEEKKNEKVVMMDLAPFSGQAFCSDDECPCNNTTMPPAQGYLWIKPEVAQTRLNCLSLPELLSKLKETGAMGDITKMRKYYLPIAVCKVSAMKHNLDMKVAEDDYNSWTKTGKVACRPTPNKG